MKRVIHLLVAVIVCSSAGMGQRSATANLERLVKEAGIIFGGKVIGVETGRKYTAMNLYATTYTFLVTEPVYGVTSDTLTIRQYGGEADGRTFYPPGIPRFEEGEEVLVLMYAPSRVGMTSTVGKEQGKFLIHETDSARWVVNSLENKGLFSRLTHPEILADQSWIAANPAGPLPYDKFVETLKELVHILKN